MQCPQKVISNYLKELVHTKIFIEAFIVLVLGLQLVLGLRVNKTDKDLAHLELTFLVEKMDKQANKQTRYILNCGSCSVVSDSLRPMDYTIHGIL